MILITGAGGKTGKAVLKSLSNVDSICAFVHHAEDIEVVKSLGAGKVVVGDMRDKSVIGSAMQGIKAVYHLCPNMNPDEVMIGKLVIGAARENGVEQFIYHSVLHPQTKKMKHHWHKMRVEEMVFESGLAYTILQPAPYMQNLLAGWKRILDEGVLSVPYSINSNFSFVDLEDVAETAKIVLSEPNHKNVTYELVGISSMSHMQVAEIFSRVLGRDIHAEKEETSEWKLRAPGLTEYATENLVKMFEYYDRYGLVGNPTMLNWVLKREPTSFESFIRRTLKDSDVPN